MKANFFALAIATLAVGPLCLVAWVWINTAWAELAVPRPFETAEAAPIWLEFEPAESASPAPSASSASVGSSDATAG